MLNVPKLQLQALMSPFLETLLPHLPVSRFKQRCNSFLLFLTFFTFSVFLCQIVGTVGMKDPSHAASSAPQPELHIASSRCCGGRLDPNTCQRQFQRQCQIECQIECQNRCQNECQNECMKRCQIECQKECQHIYICQNVRQNRYQIECQIECQNIYMQYFLPDGMSENMSEECVRVGITR